MTSIRTMGAFLLPVLAVALLGSLVLALAPARAGTPAPPPRVCFSAHAWSANDGLRPCVRVTTVQEDGSFAFAVSDANGTTRYTASVGALDR